jgi:hypothetical protein
MLVFMPVVYKDYNGNEAQHRAVVNIAPSVTFDTMGDIASSFVDAVKLVSLAVPVSLSIIVPIRRNGLGEPAEDSDVYDRTVLCFLRNSSKIGTLSLPSMPNEWFDVNPPMAGKRILERVTELNAHFDNIYTQTGYRIIDELGNELLSLIVGGRAQ